MLASAKTTLVRVGRTRLLLRDQAIIGPSTYRCPAELRVPPAQHLRTSSGVRFFFRGPSPPLLQQHTDHASILSGTRSVCQVRLAGRKISNPPTEAGRRVQTLEPAEERLRWIRQPPYQSRRSSPRPRPLPQRAQTCRPSLDVYPSDSAAAGKMWQRTNHHR